MIQRLDALEVKSQAVDAAARKAAQVAEAAVQRIYAMEKQQSSGKAGRWVGGSRFTIWPHLNEHAHRRIMALPCPCLLG